MIIRSLERGEQSETCRWVGAAGRSTNRLPFPLVSIPPRWRRLIQCYVIVEVCHCPELLCPPGARTDGRPNDKLVVLNDDFDLAAQLHLIEQSLWDADAARVAEVDDFCFDGLHGDGL